MSEFKGTPGPWAYGPSGPVMAGYSQTFGVCQFAKPNLVAGCFGDVAGGAEVAEANARLIAAAPDLLEACQALPGFDINRPDASDFKDHAYQFVMAMRLARAAIAKALGQS